MTIMCAHCEEPVGHKGNCLMKKPSASDEKGASPDDRHFAVIQVTLYDDARCERVVDSFSVNTWAKNKAFKALKEFFLESVLYTEQELMK